MARSQQPIIGRLSMQRAITSWLCTVFLISVVSASPAPIDAQNQALLLEQLTDQLDRPWGMSLLPDQSLLISERSGQLRRWHRGTLSAPIRGLPDVYDAGQGGLLDVLAAADFGESGKVWISHSAGNQQANHTVVSELALNLDGAQPQVKNVRTVFSASPKKSGSVHFGGRLVSRDSKLWLTLGDGFDFREAAQDPASHLGKVIQLDLSGSAPPRVYSSGHRNAQGLVWHQQLGALLLHEHGPRGGDELNILVDGANFGWPAISAGLDYSGAQVTPFRTHPNFRSPIYTWTPSIAPSGMVIYQGTMFPEWNGSLLITALAGRTLHRLTLLDGKVTGEEILLADRKTRWRDIELAADGSVYLLSDGEDAALFKLSRAQK
jgi:aldose sugar dehydrogenase